eukprot:6957691-Prymnesium_polylepis.1
MVCGANGIWAPDSGKSALNKLAMRMQVNVSQLAHSPDFMSMVSALADDGKLEQLKRVITSKKLKEKSGIEGLHQDPDNPDRWLDDYGNVILEIDDDMLHDELRNVCL